MVSRTIVSRKPRPIHAEGNVQLLQGDVMDNHVKSTLHEGGINCQERLHSPRGHPCGKERGMLFSNTNIVESVWMTRCILGKSCSVRHCCRDGNDLSVVICKVRERFSKNLGISGG